MYFKIFLKKDYDEHSFISFISQNYHDFHFVSHYIYKVFYHLLSNDNDYYHRMRLRYDTTDDEYKITLGKFYGGSGLGFPGPVTVVKEGKIKLETSPDSNTNYVEFYPTLLTTPNTIIHYDNIADKTNSDT